MVRHARFAFDDSHDSPARPLRPPFDGEDPDLDDPPGASLSPPQGAFGGDLGPDHDDTEHPDEESRPAA